MDCERCRFLLCVFECLKLVFTAVLVDAVEAESAEPLLLDLGGVDAVEADLDRCRFTFAFAAVGTFGAARAALCGECERALGGVGERDRWLCRPRAAVAADLGGGGGAGLAAGLVAGLRAMVRSFV